MLGAAVDVEPVRQGIADRAHVPARAPRCLQHGDVVAAPDELVGAGEAADPAARDDHALGTRGGGAQDLAGRAGPARGQTHAGGRAQLQEVAPGNGHGPFWPTCGPLTPASHCGSIGGIRGREPTTLQTDVDDRGLPPPLVALDRVLDGLLTVLNDSAPDRIDAAARGYVEDAVSAAMAAALRARDNDLAGAAAGPIGDAATVARALLAELRDSSARSEALVNRSLELRRQAIRLTASALALRRQPQRVDPRGGLHGIRVLVVGDTPGLVEKFTMLLSALGADVRAASGLREAGQDARRFDPDALLCEMPADPLRARALADDLGREGLGLPTVAMTASADAATRAAGLAAGFVDVLGGPVTFSDLAETIRRAIGR